MIQSHSKVAADSCQGVNMKENEILLKKIKSAKKAAELAGGLRPLAKLCNLKYGSICRWMKKGIPLDRVSMVSNLLNNKITKHELAPNHFDK